MHVAMFGAERVNTVESNIIIIIKINVKIVDFPET